MGKNKKQANKKTMGWEIGFKIALRTKLENIVTDQRVMVIIEDVSSKLLAKERIKTLKKLKKRYKEVQSVLEEDEIPNYMGILELEIEKLKT